MSSTSLNTINSADLQMYKPWNKSTWSKSSRFSRTNSLTKISFVPWKKNLLILTLWTANKKLTCSTISETSFSKFLSLMCSSIFWMDWYKKEGFLDKVNPYLWVKSIWKYTKFIILQTSNNLKLRKFSSLNTLWSKSENIKI